MLEHSISKLISEVDFHYILSPGKKYAKNTASFFPTPTNTALNPYLVYTTLMMAPSTHGYSVYAPLRQCVHASVRQAGLLKVKVEAYWVTSRWGIPESQECVRVCPLVCEWVCVALIERAPRCSHPFPFSSRCSKGIITSPTRYLYPGLFPGALRGKLLVRRRRSRWRQLPMCYTHHFFGSERNLSRNFMFWVYFWIFTVL